MNAFANVGRVFHFLIGGGGVALLDTAELLARGEPLTDQPFLDGLMLGLATSVLPWLVLLPAIG